MILDPVKKAIKKTRFKSGDYWEKRYLDGDNSGPGSYGKFAEFKAQIINDFVKEHSVKRVIEFGSGDGNQLTLANYPEYIGLDVSKRAVEICIEMFKDDDTKSFFLYSPNHFYNNGGLKADLAMSLDVIFHLVEDEVYEAYMKHLFSTSDKYIIICSSNKDQKTSGLHDIHVRHRKFTNWIEKNAPDWQQIDMVENEHQLHDDPNNKTFADFYFFEKK
jgi:hypothetical protein